MAVPLDWLWRVAPVLRSIHGSSQQGSTLLRSLSFVAAALVASTAPAIAQAPAALVSQAVAAIGGEQALRAVRTTRVQIVSVAFDLGQANSPSAFPTVTTFSGWQATDGPRERHTYVLESRPGPGGTGIGRQRGVFSGGIGMLEDETGQRLASAAQLAAAHRSMRLSLGRLLLSALADSAALAPGGARSRRGDTVLAVHYASASDTVALLFDRDTGMPAGIESVSKDPVRGERVTTTWFSRWESAGPLRLPRQSDTEVNGRLASQVITTARLLNPVLPDSIFAIPDSVARDRPRAP